MSAPDEEPASIVDSDREAVDIPEPTDDELDRARPFREVHPELHASWKRGRGRPRVATPKAALNFRWSADTVARIRSSGPGYGERVEKAVRAALDRGEI